MDKEQAKQTKKMSSRKKNLLIASCLFIADKIISFLFTGLIIQSIGAALELIALFYLILGIINYKPKERI
jgi:cytochrome c biogenesis protein CcdA